MGCTSSKLVTAEAPGAVSDHLKAAPKPHLNRLSITGDFDQYESMNRGSKVYDNDSATSNIEGPHLSMYYAFHSQRGYYPDQPKKANQDAVFSSENVNNAPGQHLVGVLDGHGETGADCSMFAKAMLPSLIAGDKELHSNPAGVLQRALTTVNEKLHASVIDDSLSGSTACLALLQHRSLCVANVGDSRAVIAHLPPGASHPTAVELTQDQTPFREDECERVRLAGARIMTLDQMEGVKPREVRCWTNEAECDGDPPRLWAQNGTYPGTAFTRSIGDSMAEAIGVVAEPEVTELQLTPEYPFLVVATDGIWEFMSSQQVVDIVAASEGPEEAVVTLVSTAYEKWLRRERRTDDISVVVIFLSYPETKSLIQ